MTFSEAVCRAVYRIPRGKVATYGQIAAIAGKPRAARAVASAMRSGPRGMPWHRVLGAGGRIKLTGTNAMEQRLLLESEGIRLQGMSVSLATYGWRLSLNFKFHPVK